MPRHYKAKGVIQMDRTELEKAFNYRVETGCGLREAAKRFGVKRATLHVRGLLIAFLFFFLR